MSKTIVMTVPVEVEVDLDDWMRTYGQTEQEAREDAAVCVPKYVAEGVHLRLEAVSNGASLVGDLSSELDGL